MQRPSSLALTRPQTSPGVGSIFTICLESTGFGRSRIRPPLTAVGKVITVTRSMFNVRAAPQGGKVSLRSHPGAVLSPSDAASVKRAIRKARPVDTALAGRGDGRRLPLAPAPKLMAPRNVIRQSRARQRPKDGLHKPDCAPQPRTSAARAH